MDADKVAAMRAWQTPRTVCVVRGFLGLTGYYRKFINGDIATPLTQLLKWEVFRWMPAAAAAFESLKAAMTAAPVLQLPDFTRSFIVDCDASDSGYCDASDSSYCDASDSGFGAVLHHGAGPITFLSRGVAPHHAKLAAYERQLIGLVKVVCH
jgi:hypothetical protein